MSTQVRDAIRHWPLINTKQVKLLRLRDPVEREAGKVRQHRPPRKR